MNFTNLWYFVTVAEELNMSKAAQKLYISQQSLSNHISRMEQEFGAEMFERTPRLKLTYAGECTLKMAREILSLNRQMRTQIDDISNQRKGELNIGVATRVCGRIVLPQVLPKYHQLYPNVELHLETGLTLELLEHLREGELDLILGVQFPEYFPEIIAEELYQERLCLVVPKRIMHDLFPENTQNVVRSFNEKGVDLGAFKNAPFLLMEEGKRIRNHSDKLFAQEGYAPNIILQSTDIEILFGLCFSGLGVMFAFEESIRKYFPLENDLRNIMNPVIYAFPIIDTSAVGHTLLYYNKERYISKASKDFIQLLYETFNVQERNIAGRQ
ncbi:MAG: LysR family transcriptional regulator [Lachnospiraceae bacterium]|nr:LysR family transcriptional regulator [Lachnospiraceae bacterium]